MGNPFCISEFFGHTPEYWLELEKQVKNQGMEKLIDELAAMRAKVSFYESRIQELSKFMNLRLEIKCS